MSKLKVLDLFSGIGGFSLGLERTGGFQTVQFCEIDPYCQQVLRKHWPEVPIHDDIKTLWRRPSTKPDIITGGFPCQPFSSASRGRANARDLWPNMLYEVATSQPAWVLAENVPGLGYGGVDRVCDDLERLGYTTEALRVDTALPGRHRKRDRFIFLAHANREGQPRFPINGQMAGLSRIPKPREEDLARTLGVDDGLSSRLDRHRMKRLKALGNAIVPQIAELIGHAILDGPEAA